MTLEELKLVNQALRSFPYSASLIGINRAENAEEVAGQINLLAGIVKNEAEKAAKREGELVQLRADMVAVRRVLGVPA